LRASQALSSSSLSASHSSSAAASASVELAALARELQRLVGFAREGAIGPARASTFSISPVSLAMRASARLSFCLSGPCD
jgi:hypothetical protein